MIRIFQRAAGLTRNFQPHVRHAGVAQPDEKKRREREARQIRQLLFGRVDDDHTPDNPLPPGPADDETWPEQIDQLCDSLFNSEEESAEVFTAQPRVTDGQSLCVSEKARSPRPQATAVMTRRHTLKRRQAVEKRVTQSATIPRWRKFLVAACLLAGCCLFFRGLLSLSQSDTPIRPHVTAKSTPTTTTGRYVTSNIEDLQVNDIVLAMNPETGETEHRQIVDVFERTAYELRVLTIRGPDGKEMPPIRTTDEHPFWVVEFEDFLSAADLEVGDTLLGPDGEQTTLVSSEVEPHPEGITVYNFEVEGAHTYFVIPGKGVSLQDLPVLVHNAAGGSCRLRPEIKKPPGAGNKKGSYTVKFKSGKSYHGKGTWARARASARRIINRMRDEKPDLDEDAIEIDWKPAKGNTDKQAFIDEAIRIDADGGVGADFGNYNQINSPGKKYLPQP